jgi:multiple sugar transport system ATP-binding protein
MYVAEFVGKPRMSLVEGALEYGADTVTFVGKGLRVELGPAAAIGLPDGSWPAVVLGVRSEDLIVEVDGASAAGRGFEAKVGLTEPIGSDTFVELEAGETSMVARVDPDLPLALDQPVTARFRRSGIHLFDKETGERIN